MRKKIDCEIGSSISVGSGEESTPFSSKRTPTPTEGEINQLFKSLHIGGGKCEILSLVEPYANDFIPEVDYNTLSMPLTELRDESAFSLNFAELLNLCQETEKTINVTEHQANQVEKVTQSQADSKKIWLHFRAGRIAASKMKSTCHTNPAQPSESLVKSICCTDAHGFFSAATKWGSSHEKQALEWCLREKVSSAFSSHLKSSLYVLR